MPFGKSKFNPLRRNPFAPFIDPNSREALDISALGGDAQSAASVRSAAFAGQVAGLQQRETPEDFLQRQFDLRRERMEAAGSARGIREGGELARDVLNLEQDRLFRAQQINSRGGSRGGRGTVRTGATPGGPGVPAGPPVVRGPEAAPVTGGLELPTIETTDVDRGALERELAIGQREFTNLVRGATGSGINLNGQFMPTATGGGDEVRRQGLAAMRSDFGTLQPAARVSRAPGEDLDAFLRREERERQDPRNMTKATLAGKTLELIGTRDGAVQQLERTMEEFQTTFQQESLQDRTFLNNITHRAQQFQAGDPSAVLAEVRAVLPPQAFTDLDRILQATGGVFDPNDSTQRGLVADILDSDQGRKAIEQMQRQFQQQEKLAQGRMQGRQEQAAQEAREIHNRMTERIATADAQIKANVAVLNEKAALVSRLNTNAARRAAQGLDENIYKRASRQMGVDPQAINDTTGLPQWQHMRMFVDQDEIRKTLIESHVTRAGRALREKIGLSALERIEEQVQGAEQAEQARKGGTRRGPREGVTGGGFSSQQSAFAGQAGAFGGGGSSLFNTGGTGGLTAARSVFGQASGLAGQF